jgi:PAS domain S-box-containing protein
MEALANDRGEPEALSLPAERVLRQVRDHAMFLIDRHGRIASWNEGVGEILGWEEADWRGQPVHVAFTPEDIARGVPEAELRNALENGRADDDRWMQCKDGRRFFALGAVTRLVDDDDRPIGFLKVLRDFTAQKEAQAEREQLLSSERDARAEAERQAAALTAALEAIPQGLGVAMPAGGVARYNAPALAMFGVSSSDELPSDAQQLVQKFRLRRQRDGPPLLPAELPSARALTGDVSQLEAWATRADSGEDVFIRTASAPILVDGRVAGIVTVHSDLSDLLRMQQQGQELSRISIALRERDEELRALLQGVRNYAIYTLDTQGRISSWHVGAALMKGYSAEQAIGMPFADLFTPEDRAAGLPTHEMEIAARTGEYKGEGLRVRRDGSTLEAAVVLTALRGADGQLMGYLKLTQDISVRKRHEREREEALRDAQRARVEAERANRSKGEFLATLSHEMRTPLSAILGWARVLESGPPDSQRLVHGLGAIARNARMQVQLIEDLLDMNRIDSGLLRLDMQPVELGSVVAAAVDSVQPLAAAKDIDVRTVGDGARAVVSGDPGRLQQIVGNLLDNAVKFTPRGGRVGVAMARADDAVEIRVTDSGQGIEPHFLDRVFERFQQQDSTRTRRYGGLGIGLAVVRELVRLHGGTVRAESAGRDRGASFTVTLPALLVADGPTVTSPQENDNGIEDEPPLPRIDGVTVLLIDDEPDVRSTAEHLLRDAGAHVLSAGSALDGFALLKAFRPHVVVSDIGMPGHDGYELMRWVRGLPDRRARQVPAVAFTAYAGSEHRRRAEEAGYQAHLVKPVSPFDLVSTVAALAAGAPR